MIPCRPTIYCVEEPSLIYEERCQTKLKLEKKLIFHSQTDDIVTHRGHIKFFIFILVVQLRYLASLHSQLRGQGHQNIVCPLGSGGLDCDATLSLLSQLCLLQPTCYVLSTKIMKYPQVI